VAWQAQQANGLTAAKRLDVICLQSAGIFERLPQCNVNGIPGSWEPCTI
jgi:hypothetical protein